MPHIRMRGLMPAEVQKLSESLAEDLALVIGTSADNFTIEHVQSQFFSKGHPDTGYPIIEVLWFARSPEIAQKAATLITERLKIITQAADVAVIFHALQKSDYFENGRHF